MSSTRAFTFVFSPSIRAFTLVLMSSIRLLMPPAMMATNPTITVMMAIPVPMTETTMVLVSVIGSSPARRDVHHSPYQTVMATLRLTTP